MNEYVYRTVVHIRPTQVWYETYARRFVVNNASVHMCSQVMSNNVASERAVGRLPIKSAVI
jgi:hypothetical protein